MDLGAGPAWGRVLGVRRKEQTRQPCCLPASLLSHPPLSDPRKDRGSGGRRWSARATSSLRLPCFREQQHSALGPCPSPLPGGRDPVCHSAGDMATRARAATSRGREIWVRGPLPGLMPVAGVGSDPDGPRGWRESCLSATPETPGCPGDSLWTRNKLAATEGPVLGVFPLVCWVRRGGREWKHDALATFFIETREPMPSLAPRELPGRLSAVDCADPGPRASPPQAREPRGRSGCSGTCRGQPSCCFRGSAPRPKCAGVACGAPDLRQFRHSRRGPLSARAAFRASLHYKQRGAVSRGPPLVCLEVTLSLQARFPSPF